MTASAEAPAELSGDAMNKLPISSDAVPTPPDAELMQSLATRVLADDAFGGEEKQLHWGWDWRNGFRWPDDEPPAPDAPGDMAWLHAIADAIGAFSNVMLWLLLLLLLYAVWHNRHRFSGVLSAASTRERKAGIDVAPLLRPDALPADIAAAAQSLWDSGRCREALALLYRAALLRLGNEYGFAVPVSGTEGECRRLVERHVGGERASAFGMLVGIWSRCAWAHLLPASLAAPLTHFHAAVRSEMTSAATTATTAPGAS